MSQYSHLKSIGSLLLLEYPPGGSLPSLSESSRRSTWSMFLWASGAARPQGAGGPTHVPTQSAVGSSSWVVQDRPSADKRKFATKHYGRTQPQASAPLSPRLQD